MRALLLLLAAFSAHAEMALNPDVTQDNIASTVCVPNWSASVRPPASFTDKIKAQKMAALGIARDRARELELDHILSIEAGGSPTNPDNLRLQWWYGDDVETPSTAGEIDSQAHAKDVLENAVKRRICSGRMTLGEGRACLWNDWRACAKSLGLPSRKEAPR